VFQVPSPTTGPSRRSSISERAAPPGGERGREEQRSSSGPRPMCESGSPRTRSAHADVDVVTLASGRVDSPRPRDRRLAARREDVAA
jgi:hypothetical protein